MTSILALDAGCIWWFQILTEEGKPGVKFTMLISAEGGKSRKWKKEERLAASVTF